MVIEARIVYCAAIGKCVLQHSTVSARGARIHGVPGTYVANSADMAATPQPTYRFGP